MKVHYDQVTGAMSFDVTTVTEAVELARQLRNGAHAREAAKVISTQASDAGMTESQYLTWDFLVRNEGKLDGVTLTELAQHLGISHDAVSQRVKLLVEAGFAIRLSRGRYKAVLP